MSSSIESLKIVLIGEPYVGKTSIISQFVDKTFQEDMQSSSSGTFNSKRCIYGDNKSLRLDIWDTAGQEKYRSLTKMFYKDANVAILVYNITDKNSYEQLKEYWHIQVKESGPKDLLLVICANKSDLINEEQVDEGEARNYAQEIGALFFTTSAKNDYGISDLFLQTAKKYLGVDDIRLQSHDEIKDNEDDVQNERMKKRGSVKLTKNQIKEKNKETKHKKCC